MEVRTYKVNRPVYCMKLTRSGGIVPDTPEVKKELTVRPIVNADFGVAPPSFKVFRKAKSGLCVPRYYAEERFGLQPRHQVQLWRGRVSFSWGLPSHTRPYGI